MLRPYNIDYVPEPFGLRNTRVNCWANATLQMMLGLSSINKILLGDDPDVPDIPTSPLSQLYNKILTSATGADETAIDLPTSGALVAKLIKNTYTQECADEAYTRIIQLFKSPHIDKLVSLMYENRITCECRRSSEVRDTVSRVLVNHSDPTPEGFALIIMCAMAKCDTYKCVCGLVGNAKIITKLRRTGSVIIVTFNKFTKKHVIQFPPYFELKNSQNVPRRYVLVGIVEHLGSANTASGGSYGHYRTKTLRDSQWWVVDDTSVTKCTTTEAMEPSEHTFMLAYHLA